MNPSTQTAQSRHESPAGCSSSSSDKGLQPRGGSELFAAKEIVLTNGMVTLVDEADYEDLSRFTWRFFKGYAGREFRDGGKKKFESLHRRLMGFPELEVDHIDRNPLNNKRSNLRLATHRQNTSNRSVHKNNRSGIAGIKVRILTRGAGGKSFTASISVCGKLRNLGVFRSLSDAINAREKATKELFGEFAPSGNTTECLEGV